MQGIGQLLVSTLLLLLPLLSVLAHKTDDSPSHLNKRSLHEVSSEETSWQAPLSSDDVTAAKRFNEFVGKRAQSLLSTSKASEMVNKRSPYELLYNRILTKRSAGDAPARIVKRSSQYEFLGKRPLSLPSHKRAVLDYLAKRVLLPYEFVGKRIFGSAWERVSANAIEGDALIKDVTDILNKRDSVNHQNIPEVRNKRYAEWLGKRGGPIADQLLRDLVNKRISVMMRNRLQSSAPEFIGRREEDSLPQDEEVQKRYTEFIGK